MDIEQRIRRAQNLTPTEEDLARTILVLGEQLNDFTIKEFARWANVSVASIHRFCKKLDIEGFKELKIELTRSIERRRGTSEVDINFPFDASTPTSDIASRISGLYRSTIEETHALLTDESLERAADLLANAEVVQIYTQSHNLAPATTFSDRLLSIGIPSTCYPDYEAQVRCAAASNERYAAIVISYSGLQDNVIPVLTLLRRNHTPVIYIGSLKGTQRHPGLDIYLPVSDQESFVRRLSQFSSHVAVQYVLDTLFSCVFARSYDQGVKFLQLTFPFTVLREQPPFSE